MRQLRQVVWFLTFTVISLCFISAFSPPSIGIDFSTSVGKKLTSSRVTTSTTNAELEILLGETKYYQAIVSGGRLVIQELTEPKLCGNVPDVVFEVIREARDTLGVYYDYKDELGNDLPSGMIRLIGRYWDGGEPYKVRLTVKRQPLTVALYAQSAGIASSSPAMRGSLDVASETIEVTRPARLIDKEEANNFLAYQGSDYSTTIDVFGNPLDIDSLIIEYAGRSGIPPQYIKGQMFQESDKTGGRFNPSYRYEPGEDFKFQSKEEWRMQYFRSSYPFVVMLDPQSMGGDLPTNHTNVRPYDYQRYPVTIAWYVGSRIDQYYRRDENDNNRLIFLGGKVGEALTEKWGYYFWLYSTKLPTSVMP